MKAGVLDGQDDGVVSGFIVMGVPESWRSDEDGPWDPIGFDGVDDVPVLIELIADQRVRAGLRIDTEIDGNGVVAMRLLHDACGQHVEEGPKDVGEGEGLRCRGIAEKDSHPVAVDRAGLIAHIGEFLMKAFAGEEGGLELRFGRFDAEIAQKGFIVDPVQRGIAVPVVFQGSVGGDNEEVAFRPSHIPGGTCGSSISADHIEHLRGRDGGGCELFARKDAEVRCHQAGSGGGEGGADALREVEWYNAGGTGLMFGCWEHIDGDGGHAGVCGGCVLKEADVLFPRMTGCSGGWGRDHGLECNACAGGDAKAVGCM